VSTRDRARAHGVLSVPARLTILDWLRASTEPVNAHAVAAAVGLHVTTARSHLDALIEAGLVVSYRQPRNGRGRPRTLYTPSFHGAAQDGGPYRELAELLAAHFAGAPSRPAYRAELAGRDWASRRLDVPAGASHSPAQARQVVTGLFTEMGFDPEPAPGERVLLHGCPFRAVARSHPEVVCAAHRGLLAGLLARLDPAAPPPDLEPFADPDLCVIAFGERQPVPDEVEA
jgi:predicted ArsR family transcriptional regulator